MRTRSGTISHPDPLSKTAEPDGASPRAAGPDARRGGGKRQVLPGRSVMHLKADAVLAGVPVQRDLDATAPVLRLDVGLSGIWQPRCFRPIALGIRMSANVGRWQMATRGAK